MKGDRRCHPLTIAAIDWSSWVPDDRATLVFVVCDGRILLIHKLRGLGRGKINGPGGKIEVGETARACAVREVTEELGIIPLDPVEVGELSFVFTDGYSTHVTVFLSSRFVGEPTASREATPLWCDLAAIPYGEMWADDELWMPLMLAGKRFNGRFVFDHDTMLDHDLREE